MPSPRPFAGAAVALVLGTGVVAGAHLTSVPTTPNPDRAAAAGLRPTGGPEVAAGPAGTAAPPVTGPVAPAPPAAVPPATAPPAAAPPATAPPAAAPVVRRGPTAAQQRYARRQAARDRLRQRAIAICRALGYSQRRCNTAPR